MHDDVKEKDSKQINNRLFAIREDLKKRYEEHRLKSEIYLWQLHIIEHPEDKECYENAIKGNLDKLKGCC